LAKVICETGDNIEFIQRDVFLNAKFPNGMVKCSKIPDISLEPWLNCCSNSADGLCSEPSIYNTNSETGKLSKRNAEVGKKCFEDDKAYFDDERWLKGKCTECVCVVSHSKLKILRRIFLIFFYF
jgi:hypothetical protein